MGQLTKVKTCFVTCLQPGSSDTRTMSTRLERMRGVYQFPVAAGQNLSQTQQLETTEFFFSYLSGSQQSKVSLPWLKSRCQQGHSPPGGSSDNAFPCIFQHLELHSLYSQAGAPSPIFIASTASILLDFASITWLFALVCVANSPLAPSFKDSCEDIYGPPR